MPLEKRSTPVSEQPIDPDHRFSSSSRVELSPLLVGTTARKRVLLVDDNLEWTILLGPYLEDPGMEVVAVNDSRLALTMGRAFEPHAVILDLEMPEVNGVDVAWQFANDPVLRKVPILICTAHAQKYPRAQLPPDEILILPKPVSPRLILEWLQNHAR